MDELRVYDKAKYHMTGAAGGAPDWEHAAGPALFFLRWLIARDLAGAYFLQQSAAALGEYAAGAISLFELYEKDWDLRLTSEMLSDEGDAFARFYFDYDHGRYLADLAAVLSLKSSGYPLFTEQAYLLVQPIIDTRFHKWKTGDLQEVAAPGAKSSRSRILRMIGGFLVLLAIFAASYLLIHILETFFGPK